MGTKILEVKLSLEELQCVPPTALMPSQAGSASKTLLWPVKLVLMPDISSAGLPVTVGPQLQEPMVALVPPKPQVSLVGMVAATPSAHGQSVWGQDLLLALHLAPDWPPEQPPRPAQVWLPAPHRRS